MSDVAFTKSKEALKQIGLKALAESRCMSLTVSAEDRQNEADERTRRGHEDHSSVIAR